MSKEEEKLKDSWIKINELGLEVFNECRAKIVELQKEGKLTPEEMAKQTAELQVIHSYVLAEKLSDEEIIELVASVISSSTTSIIAQAMGG